MWALGGKKTPTLVEAQRGQQQGTGHGVWGQVNAASATLRGYGLRPALTAESRLAGRKTCGGGFIHYLIYRPGRARAPDDTDDTVDHGRRREPVRAKQSRRRLRSRTVQAIGMSLLHYDLWQSRPQNLAMALWRKSRGLAPSCINPNYTNLPLPGAHVGNHSMRMTQC